MMRAQGLVDKCSQWAGEGRARRQLHIIRMQSTPGHITASVVLLLAAVGRATAPYENTRQRNSPVIRAVCSCLYVQQR